MPIETRTNSALFRRAEQLKRWEQSETNKVPHNQSSEKKNKIQFSDGCVFLAACAASDTEEVERLLAQGTDINTANVDGLTALHQACIDNNLEMVQFLVEHNCDVNRGDNEGWTPLHATASCGFLSIAKYLMENGANVAAVNNDGDLPLDIAESSTMEDYLSDVIDEKEIDCDEARSEEERIMLEDAKLMASSSIDINDKVHQRTGATPLHVAAAKGYLEVLKILVQAGADLNAQDNDGWTPLHAASHWCQKEACAILTDNLANMDIQNLAGQSCFDVADPDVVKLLNELKKKQASMQKERPEIQEILKRTSNRPPLKRRTSVTRMSGQEKSKSVMKDTKSERAQIESMSLPEEENDEEKGRKHWQHGKQPDIPAERADITKINPTVSCVYSYKELIKKCEESGLKFVDSSSHDTQKESNPDALMNLTVNCLYNKKELMDKCAVLGLKYGDTPLSDSPQIGGNAKVLEKNLVVKCLDSFEELKKKSEQLGLKFEDCSQPDSKIGRNSGALKKNLAVNCLYTYEELIKESDALGLNLADTLLDKSQAKPLQKEPQPKEPEVEKIPSWKKVLRRASEESASLEANVSEVILKRPKKLNDDKEKDGEYLTIEKRPSISPVRDDESELQRKAHAKRVRETRRSTQGVLLEDIKSAELQYLINTQQEAALRQAQESKSDPLPNDKPEASLDVHSSLIKKSKDSAPEDSKDDSHSSKIDVHQSPDASTKISSPATDNAPSVTVVLRQKASSSPEDTSPSEIKSSLGTQAAIQRRRRPKRRSTGVVYLDSDEAPDEKDGANGKDSTVSSESVRSRYGSSTSIPDSASDVSSKSDSSRVSEDEIREYKKLYEDVKKENEDVKKENASLKEQLKKTEEELETAKKQLQKLSQGNIMKSSISEAEKKERRSLERKLSEMEEELKQIDKLKADNDRMKEDNAALIRVISKISQ